MEDNHQSTKNPFIRTRCRSDGKKHPLEIREKKGLNRAQEKTGSPVRGAVALFKADQRIYAYLVHVGRRKKGFDSPHRGGD